MIFADTNVLLDVLHDDPSWADWSQQQLEFARAVDQIAINETVFAELSVGYGNVEEVEQVLAATDILLVRTSPIALFEAGKAFGRYRAAGGTRTGVLPDFFIGAQARSAGAQLITREVRRYRTYFPDLELIAPNLT